MGKVQEEQIQTVAEDAAAEVGFWDTTAEQVAIMVKTVVQAVSGLAEAQVLGCFCGRFGCKWR
jgi:tRNA/tmRNA/rRNA uracil-C5-methylase (TrmA/RlmC/RlmD family)